METISKAFSLILIAILASSTLTMIESTVAQSTLKPTVPEFSLKIVSHPYDIAPTTTIEPYTGKNITTNYGRHEENTSIEVTIKNQPFTSTLDASGNYTNLYYNIRFKGHYSDEWRNTNAVYNTSKDGDTIVPIYLSAYSISTGGQVDFQVRSAVGHLDIMRYDDILPPEMQYYLVFAGQTGDWSSTQTIIVEENSSPTVTPFPTSSPKPTITSTTTATPTPTTTPNAIDSTGSSITLPKTTLELVVAVFIGITVALLMLLFIRRGKSKKVPSNLSFQFL